MDSYKNRELVKVAYYYYKKELTQNEISKKMGMSRQRVNRLLKKAREKGIVKIQIADVEKYDFELETKLEEKFNLKESVVTFSIDDENVTLDLGIAGAKYLEELVEKGDMIGVTWGRTLSEVAMRLSDHKDYEMPVVQLVGGMNIAYTALKPDEITRTIAEKFGGTPYLLYSPASVENKETKDAIMSDNSIKKTFNMMEKCNIIVVGIGELTKDSTLYTQKYFNEKYISHLVELGCVGDIGFGWYDKNGNVVKHDYLDRTIGYDIFENKNDALVVAVAGEEKKYEAILGALRGNFIDVLITDRNMAQKLVET
ncbi:MAG TPA: sugar-binding transcriptional regulator [Tissierellales bacterium]|nr:sugar-binding transcriptional regulator [Tissierellales bacterium]